MIKDSIRDANLAKKEVSRKEERRKLILEEKPSKFERITLEFNAIYNELLSNVRDRKNNEAQKKFLQLYDIYRKISKESISDKELGIIEQQLKEIAGVIPSEEPPHVALPLAIIAGVLVWALFGSSITGMASVDLDGQMQIGTGIYADSNAVFQASLSKAPSSLSVSGRAFGNKGGNAGRARIYLVDEGRELLVADKTVTNGDAFFIDECIETCRMPELGKSIVTLIIRIENAEVEIDGITYS